MNSQDYWAKREAEQLKRNITDEKEYDKQLKRIYLDMLDGVQGEIDHFYSRYASKEGITIAEAKKRVSNVDIERYERKAKKYVEAAAADRKANGGQTNYNGYYFSQKANDEMRLYNLTMKVNRLELLKANIGLELVKGHAELETLMGNILQDRTEAELRRQAGILGKTIRNNANTANAIVNGSFHNATFSDRIWQYHDLMKADLSKMLQTGLIQGKNPRQLAKDLRKYYIGDERLKNGKNGAIYSTERLMRTELARVQTEAQKQSFEANGFEEYTFHALSDCCDICAAINGKHFKIKKLMPGENAPPMHPHCRCSISAYEDSEEYEAWLDFLDKGGTTEEWKAKLEKSKNSSKIKSDVQHSEAYKRIIDGINANRIKYNEVKPLKSKITNNEIIERLSGGDMTKGSCSSLGFAYIGNKNGFDVLDFRGGKSRDFFSDLDSIKKIAELHGVNGKVIMAQNEINGAIEALKSLEKDKEFYFTAGKHAAIVRNTENGLEYLELQSNSKNGWTSFDKYGSTYDTLSKRFGCRKTVDKMKIGSTTRIFEKTIVVMDVDSFKGNEEFKEILGYINTNSDKQKKGVKGSVK